MRLQSTLLLLVLLALLGCSTPNGTTEQQVIRPLAVGNRWVGHTTVLDSLGRKSHDWIDTLVVSGQRTIDGEQWYITQDHIAGDTITLPGPVPAFTNRSDGQYIAYIDVSDSRFVYAPELIAKYPGRIGDSLELGIVTNETSPTAIGIWYDRIGSVDTAIDVSAGHFTAYRYDEYIAYDSTGRKAERTGAWSAWSPGVGQVAQVSLMQSPDREVVIYELKSFVVK